MKTFQDRISSMPSGKAFLGGILAVVAAVAIMGAANEFQGSSPQYNASPPTFISGYPSVLQTDVNGNLKMANGATVVNGGKSTPLLAASVLGSISGTYASGAHKLAQIQGENSSNTTVYLQVYDATSQPASNTAPVAEVLVGFGISTSPTGNRLVMTPDYLSTSTGVWFCFVTAPGAFNSANLVNSGSGLLVRVYGQ